MKIKPLVNESNQNPIDQVTQVIALKKKVVHDPKGVISPGIYRIISWEKFNQAFVLFLSTIAFFIGVILTLCYSLQIVPNTSWATYILSSLIIGISFLFLVNSLLKLRWIIKSVDVYRENIDAHFTHTPPFITKLYVRYYTNQVSHNWLFFLTVFYGGIFSILFWALKDASWWVFDFSSWISALFPNPTLVFWITFGIFAALSFQFVIITIQRKKHISDFEIFYGKEIISSKEISEIKKDRNKFFRRIFYISLIVIFVIPVLVFILVRSILRKTLSLKSS